MLKVNIEGGEYDLLPRLFDQNKMPKIKYIQVQFHDIESDSKQKKTLSEKILVKLMFVNIAMNSYENWVRKDLLYH